MKRQLINEDALKAALAPIEFRRSIRFDPHEPLIDLAIGNERRASPMPDNRLWIIDRDELNNPGGQNPTNPANEEGTWGGSKGCSVWRGGKAKTRAHDGLTDCPDPQSCTVPFRIKDDDGTIYYSGRMTKVCSVESPFAPLEDFAQPNAGATSIELKGANGRWDPI